MREIIAPLPPAAVSILVAEMKAKRIWVSRADFDRLIGIHPDSFGVVKFHGVDRHTAFDWRQDNNLQPPDPKSGVQTEPHHTLKLEAGAGLAPACDECCGAIISGLPPRFAYAAPTTNQEHPYERARPEDRPPLHRTYCAPHSGAGASRAQSA